jgi:hypothetical protein
MNTAAVKSTTVDPACMEAACVKTASVEAATAVETTTTMTTTTTTMTTATMTATTTTTGRIRQGERCCRKRKDSGKRQPQFASFEHTTLHAFHGGSESRLRKRFN